MFEPDTASDGLGATPIAVPPRRSRARPLKFGVMLGALCSATLLAWGVVENFREASDRVN